MGVALKKRKTVSISVHSPQLLTTFHARSSITQKPEVEDAHCRNIVLYD